MRTWLRLVSKRLQCRTRREQWHRLVQGCCGWLNRWSRAASGAREMGPALLESLLHMRLQSIDCEIKMASHFSRFPPRLRRVQQWLRKFVPVLVELHCVNDGKGVEEEPAVCGDEDWDSVRAALRLHPTGDMLIDVAMRLVDKMANAMKSLVEKNAASESSVDGERTVNMLGEARER